MRTIFAKYNSQLNNIDVCINVKYMIVESKKEFKATTRSSR